MCFYYLYFDNLNLLFFYPLALIYQFKLDRFDIPFPFHILFIIFPVQIND